MWHLLLAAMLAFTAVSDASMKCPRTKACTCGTFTREDRKEISCYRDAESNENMISIALELNNNVVFQCNKNMQFSDYDLLSGLEFGPLQSVIFSLCPVPNMPFDKFLESFNISGVTKFTFRFSNISDTLDRSQFEGLTNLTHLVLNNCAISEIPAGLLTDLTQLTSLEMRDNEIKRLPQMFDHQTELEYLELGGNDIEHLDEGVFRNLSKLRILSMWSNKLQNLSRNVFAGLKNLQYLELGSNKLTTLPADIFAKTPNLLEIGLYGNYFLYLPEGLFSSFTPNLKKIKLYNNKQESMTLPSGFLGNITALEEVYLNMCGLTSLPEDIFWGSKGIKNVSLQENSFTTLPEKLFNGLSKMTYLDLSFNRLEELPDHVFAKLESLETLKLSHNKISNISKILFKDLQKLRRLDMEYNNLQYAERVAFNYLEELVHLQLSHNQLTLEDKIFPQAQSLLNKCNKLEELYLSYNNITNIYEDWTFVMTNLRTLDLSHNFIRSIHAQDIHFLSDAVSVDLTYNNISVIFLRDLPKIYLSGSSVPTEKFRRILLEGNPVLCNCEIYDLLRYIEGDMNPQLYKFLQIMPGNLTCAGQSLYENFPLEKLKYKTLECALEDCPKPCNCTMRPSDKALSIYCSGKQLKEVPTLPVLEELNNPLLNHTELVLRMNKIVKLPTSETPGYNSVTKLYISHNTISGLSVENLPPTIKELELHNNNLTYINDSVLEFLADPNTELKRLTLHENPWQCDCKARGLLNFLQEHYTLVPDLTQITCGDGSGRALRNLTISELCATDNAVVIAASVTVAVLGILIGVCAALYYHFHREVKVWLFAHGWCLWFVTEEELDKDKLYDAFISYSHRDEDFVVNKLVPELERGPNPFKLCLHYRDWIAGEWIPTQIQRSVDDSKRTLVVLSPNFLESVWGRMEFRTAHSQALSEGRARVIVLLYGDVGPLDQLDPELRSYLSMNTYVKWGDPWFWDKLRYALPHPETAGIRHGIELKPSKKATDDKLELINPSTPPVATTPPTEIIITNPLEKAKPPASNGQAILLPTNGQAILPATNGQAVLPATNGQAVLLTEANGYVNKGFVKTG